MANLQDNIIALKEAFAFLAGGIAKDFDRPHEGVGSGHDPFSVRTFALTTAFQPNTPAVMFQKTTYGFSVLAGPTGGAVEAAMSNDISPANVTRVPVGDVIRFNRSAQYINLRGTIAGDYTILFHIDRFTEHTPNVAPASVPIPIDAVLVEGDNSGNATATQPLKGTNPAYTTVEDFYNAGWVCVAMSSGTGGTKVLYLMHHYA